jgi:hypothetical protein
LTITALEVRDLTLSSPILRCELSQSLSIMTGMEEVFIPVRLLRRTPAFLVLPNLDRGTDTVSMGIAELTTLTVLVSGSTKLAGRLTACTLSHCGARVVRALSMFVDKIRAPLKLGWSPSFLSRPGLVLFVGESQKEGQLPTNSIFWEGQKTIINQRLSCETAVELITPPNWEGARDSAVELITPPNWKGARGSAVELITPPNWEGARGSAVELITPPNWKGARGSAVELITPPNWKGA